MKILVFSDSHGDLKGISYAIAKNSEINTIIHLGDGEPDLASLKPITKNRTIYTVLGNMDFSKTGSYGQILMLEDKRIYLTHGHLFKVKQGRHHLAKECEGMNISLILYGHTHRGLLEVFGDTMVFNPGSCSTVYSRYATYGIVTIEKGEITCEIKNIGD